jgi:hypothetical protein
VLQNRLPEKEIAETSATLQSQYIAIFTIRENPIVIWHECDYAKNGNFGFNEVEVNHGFLQIAFNSPNNLP